jgi:hypothetical protein
MQPGNKRLLIWQSILAGLQVIAGVSDASNLIPEPVAKYWPLFVVIVGAAQVGTGFFVHGLVTVPDQTPVVVAEKGADVTIEASGPGTTSNQADLAITPPPSSRASGSTTVRMFDDRPGWEGGNPRQTRPPEYDPKHD